MPSYRYILQVAYLSERLRPDLDKRIKSVLGREPTEAFSPYVLEDRRWLVFSFLADLPLVKAALKSLKALPFVARAEIMKSRDDGTYVMNGSAKDDEDDAWAWEREAELIAAR